MVNPDGIVYPNTAAVFDDGNGLLAMKVYLGISTDVAFARAMKQEGKGPLAVFWMANPENLILVRHPGFGYYYGGWWYARPWWGYGPGWGPG